LNDRKLDTAGVFEKIFDVYRQQFAVFVQAALIVFVPIALVQALAVSADSVLLALIGAVLSFVGTFWFQGAVVEAVRDIQDGRRDLSVGDLFRSVRPILGTLMLVGVLAGLGIAVGLILLIVPGLILLTLWSVVIPVVVIERPGIGASFGRSQDLVRGNGWRVFGVIVVLFLVEIFLNQVLSVILNATDSFIGALIASLVTGVLIAPLTGIAATVVYLALRNLKGEAPVPAV
jgi:hypothetical protein